MDCFIVLITITPLGQWVVCMCGVIGNGPFVLVVIYDIQVCGLQFPNEVPPTGFAHLQAFELSSIGADREDCSRLHLADCVQNGVIAKFQGFGPLPGIPHYLTVWQSAQKSSH